MKKVMKHLGSTLLILACVFSCSCTSGGDPKPEGGNNGGNDGGGDGGGSTGGITPEEVLRQAKSNKIFNTFDEEQCWVYEMAPASNSSQATISKACSKLTYKEGTGSFKINYSFAGKSTDGSPEMVYLQERWGDYRSDLSFYPLGISVWVKGQNSNQEALRIVLIQDEALSSLESKRVYFQYTDNNVLSNSDWTRIVIPYDQFKIVNVKPGLSSTLTLNRVIGYRFEIVNQAGNANNGQFYIDALEQLTSFSPDFGTPKFKSVFVQVNQEYATNADINDWDKNFANYQAVGINEVIIQYCHGYAGTEGTAGDNYKAWYLGSKLPWIKESYELIEPMIEAAKKKNFKIIMGLYGGDYDRTKYGDKAMYDELADRCKKTFDEVYEKFGKSGVISGYYITQEFHDGTFPDGWHSESKRKLLAGFLQDVASHIHSKEPNLPVCIAPALFRGFPADKCGEWYQKIFTDAPDVDVLYLQDVAGRCLANAAVDLPNYFAKIKSACDATGVTFGVDIESFNNCWCPVVNYHSKPWNELQQQLLIAGLFTDHITNFSFVTFKDGTDSYAKYKQYVTNNGLLNK